MGQSDHLLIKQLVLLLAELGPALIKCLKCADGGVFSDVRLLRWFCWILQELNVDQPVCNCSNRVSIEYLSEGRYRLGDKTIFIRVSVLLSHACSRAACPGRASVEAEPQWHVKLITQQ